ncbi:MAG: hypothetical protein EOP18_09660 [Rhizobiaceae bacterium]|nr:MAG: hypothetical protein EOP18_09660 [Rhizobiaceae bacterium]
MLRTAFFVPAMLLAAPLAAAPVTGQWHLTGEISGESFVVDCHFEPRDKQFGGVCIDTSSSYSGNKGGKPHILTSGESDGSRISWSYDARVLFLSVGIRFTGMLNGDRMAGTISAAGRKGSFAGYRK